MTSTTLTAPSAHPRDQVVMTVRALDGQLLVMNPDHPAEAKEALRAARRARRTQVWAQRLWYGMWPLAALIVVGLVFVASGGSTPAFMWTAVSTLAGIVVSMMVCRLVSARSSEQVQGRLCPSTALVSTPIGRFRVSLTDVVERCESLTVARPESAGMVHEALWALTEPVPGHDCADHRRRVAAAFGMLGALFAEYSTGPASR